MATFKVSNTHGERKKKRGLVETHYNRSIESLQLEPSAPSYTHTHIYTPLSLPPNDDDDDDDDDNDPLFHRVFGTRKLSSLATDGQVYREISVHCIRLSLFLYLPPPHFLFGLSDSVTSYSPMDIELEKRGKLTCRSQVGQ